jgi:hypothetical protein
MCKTVVEGILETDPDAACAICGDGFAEEDPCDAAYCDVEGYVCDSCGESLVERWAAEAKRFARKHCKITIRPLPRFDASNIFAPTPEEYASGIRHANTPNSYRAGLRHNFTNYDELIKPLNKLGSERESIFYDAIRTRIEDLLAREIKLPAWLEDDDDSGYGA